MQSHPEIAHCREKLVALFLIIRLALDLVVLIDNSLSHLGDGFKPIHAVPFFFPHRAEAAFLATSERCSGVSFVMRAFAPRRPS
jgi:hypothetical protein